MGCPTDRRAGGMHHKFEAGLLHQSLDVRNLLREGGILGSNLQFASVSTISNVDILATQSSIQESRKSRRCTATGLPEP